MSSSWTLDEHDLHANQAMPLCLREMRRASATVCSACALSSPARRRCRSKTRFLITYESVYLSVCWYFLFTEFQMRVLTSSLSTTPILRSPIVKCFPSPPPPRQALAGWRDVWSRENPAPSGWYQPACAGLGPRSSRMSPASLGIGGVPFFVLRSSKSMATSSRRVCRSWSSKEDTLSFRSILPANRREVRTAAAHRRGGATLTAVRSCNRKHPATSNPV